MRSLNGDAQILLMKAHDVAGIVIQWAISVVPQNASLADVLNRASYWNNGTDGIQKELSHLDYAKLIEYREIAKENDW